MENSTENQIEEVKTFIRQIVAEAIAKNDDKRFYVMPILYQPDDGTVARWRLLKYEWRLDKFTWMDNN